MSTPIAFIQSTKLKAKPADETKLGFGSIFTDHMFVMDYVVGKGWINPRVEPFAPLLMDPSTIVLHYGQSVFEGLKAYRRADGGINLFRPELNFERINNSSRRLGIPELPVSQAMDGLYRLLEIEADWVPSAPGTSLYIRPFIIATEAHLGVKSSDTFKFMIILSPSGAYYAHGLDPVSIYIEDEFVRAVRGGTGFAKTAGNYAASILSQEIAHDKGYDQVLWLDGISMTYIEEVGSMNVFFVIDRKLVTPALNGSILPGITRRSVIELAKHWGMAVEERRLSIKELIEASEQGLVNEVFGSGTAAVISPVGKLAYEDRVFTYNDGEIGPISQKLYDTMTGIQYGELADELNWVKPLN